MTREEAISVLKETIDPNVEKSFEEWKEWDKEKRLPAIDMAIEALQAEPVKHGKWNYYHYKDINDVYVGVCECTVCKQREYSEHKYCPNCGAKMRGDKE